MAWQGNVRPLLTNNSVIGSSDDDAGDSEDSENENSSSESENEDENSNSESEEESSEELEEPPFLDTPAIDLSESIPGTPDSMSELGKEDKSPSGYFDMYLSVDEHGDYSLHMKKITAPDIMCKNNDVYFPLEQAVEVANSLEELIKTEVDPDVDDPKTFLRHGISTSHVEMWLEWSLEFNDYAIIFLSIQNGAEVSFPRAKDGAAMWCLNRIEWYRTQGMAEYSNYYL